MNGNEIRQAFLDYFERNGHKIVHSSPLLPSNDPTLLFANAGMNQFKDVFLGMDKREYSRATTSQKCIRAGGKHNDLDEVGKTARHHTFFEMLGNFSFGDYFKEDAIRFAWDFLVNELKLDKNKLWFSYFGGDDEFGVGADNEARDLWIKNGASPDRVLPFDKKDNFWQMGDTGPCGPCSEIHYFLGDDEANNVAKWVNGEGDTTMEIWNLVFMQYNRIQNPDGTFKLENLPAPSVDTGAGLERLTAVLEGHKTNYETSLIKPIVEFVAELSGKSYSYDSQEGFVMRVVADHARSTAFAIADRILPGNEGRNYVLRKIMRRAIYHGREHLGFDKLFFHQVCGFVVEQMKDAYPELAVQKDFIDKMVRLEEERFGNTLTVGSKEFENLIKNSESVLGKIIGQAAQFGTTNEELLKQATQFGTTNEELLKQAAQFGTTKETSEEQIIKSGAAVLGKEYVDSLLNAARSSVFSELTGLYDTYGYPKDLIRVKLGENGIDITEDEFNSNFDKTLSELQANSEIGKTKQAEKINPIYAALQRRSDVRTEFVGYDSTSVTDAKVVALVKDNEQVVELKTGEEGLIILDKTPFYAESGGQVGDVGTVSSEQLAGSGKENSAHRSPLTARIFDTFAPVKEYVLHKSKVESGTMKVGDVVSANVDVEKRDATRRNHTATHLAHSALREVLGTHVKQAGSVVSPNYLRFDFTHYQSLSAVEIKEIEDLVNYQILQNSKVNTDLMSIDEAMRTGAMALFGEKYGEKVRVLSVGNGEFSRELCGGIHVNATGDIGSFKITADEAIASGVRRIRAITGFDSFERFREAELLIANSLNFLKTQRDNLPSAIEKLQEELKRTRKEIDDLKLKIATGAMSSNSAEDEIKEVLGIKVLAKIVEGLDSNGTRQLSDTLLARLKSGVVVIGRSEDEKVGIIVRVSDDLTDKIKAGNIIREIAPIIGGRGGGKADMAEGGGTDASKLSEAIEASYDLIEKMLS